MKKTKIYGMGNQGEFNYIVVEKSKDFFGWLCILLHDSFGIYGVEDEEYVDKKKYIKRKKHIRNFTDKHESFHGKKARVDVFYGKNKVFIVLNTPMNNRKRFMEILMKNSIWKKPKKKR